MAEGGGPHRPGPASRNVSCSAAAPIGWGSGGRSQSGPRGSASWAGTLETPLLQGPPSTEPQAQLSQRPPDGLLSAGQVGTGAGLRGERQAPGGARGAGRPHGAHPSPQRRLRRCWVLSARSPARGNGQRRPSTRASPTRTRPATATKTSWVRSLGPGQGRRVRKGARREGARPAGGRGDRWGGGGTGDGR